MKREDTLPWYKQFWPWFIIALPASAVVAGLYTLWIAMQTGDSLVVRSDEGINTVTEQARAALKLWISETEGYLTFGQMHDEFKKVLEAAESGNFTECPWLQKPAEDVKAEYQEKMQAYQTLFQQALSVQKVGVAMMKVLLHATAASKEALLVGERATAAEACFKSKDVLKVIAVNILAAMLMESPREADYMNRYNKAFDHVTKKMKFALKDMPSKIRQFHAELSATAAGIKAGSSAVGEAPSLKSLLGSSASSSAAAATASSTATTKATATSLGIGFAALKNLKRKANAIEHS